MCTDLTSINIHSSKHHIIRWTPPQVGCVKLNIDESCGVFGDIGFGSLLRDNRRNWIVGFSSKIWVCSHQKLPFFSINHLLFLFIVHTTPPPDPNQTHQTIKNS